jgi:hypothetical protein
MIYLNPTARTQIDNPLVISNNIAANSTDVNQANHKQNIPADGNLTVSGNAFIMINLTIGGGIILSSGATAKSTPEAA